MSTAWSASSGIAIIAEREANGPFAGLDDFVGRVNAGLEQMILLIRIGAFRFTGQVARPSCYGMCTSFCAAASPTATTSRYSQLRQREFRLPQLVHHCGGRRLR